MVVIPEDLKKAVIARERKRSFEIFLVFRALVSRKAKGVERDPKRTGWTAGGEKLSDIREGTHNLRFSGTL